MHGSTWRSPVQHYASEIKIDPGLKHFGCLTESPKLSYSSSEIQTEK